MKSGELIEIRNIRHNISAKYDHDLNKLLKYYKELEQKFKKSGQYKFITRESTGYKLSDTQ